MTPVRTASSATSNQRTPIVKGRSGAKSEAWMRLLVVVDGSDESKRVIRYVAQLAAGRSRVEIQLAHLAPGLPPALLETGGAEQPEREAQIEADLRSGQGTFIAAAGRESARILQTARRALERAGVTGARIGICQSSPLGGPSAVDAVLSLARDARCGTIVVGHHAHGWLQTLGGGHLADQLARKAIGRAVWVVD